MNGGNLPFSGSYDLRWKGGKIAHGEHEFAAQLILLRFGPTQLSSAINELVYGIAVPLLTDFPCKSHLLQE